MQSLCYEADRVTKAICIAVQKELSWTLTLYLTVHFNGTATDDQTLRDRLNVADDLESNNGPCMGLAQFDYQEDQQDRDDDRRYDRIVITGCDHYTCSIHRSCRPVSIFNLIQQRLGSYPTFDQVVAYALTIASYGAAVGCALWVDQAGGGVSLFAVLSVSAAPFLPHPLPSKLQYCYCAILTVRLSMCG